MQNPNEDTEWNDILRSKGILPKKEKEVTEEDIVQMLEDTVKEKQTKVGEAFKELSLDELEDEFEDDPVMLKYRNERIQELMALAAKEKYGTLGEITGEDYVNEVNKAGDGIWVVLHLYQNGLPLCALLNKHLSILARKFRATKFLKSISVTCVPNYPDKNLPTIFVYYEGDMKTQFIGPSSFRRDDITEEELEWMLGKTGAINSDIQEDPRPKEKPKDIFYTSFRGDLEGGGENDWF